MRRQLPVSYTVIKEGGSSLVGHVFPGLSAYARCTKVSVLLDMYAPCLHSNAVVISPTFTQVDVKSARGMGPVRFTGPLQLCVLL